MSCFICLCIREENSCRVWKTPDNSSSTQKIIYCQEYLIEFISEQT